MQNTTTKMNRTALYGAWIALAVFMTVALLCLSQGVIGSTAMPTDSIFV